MNETTTPASAKEKIAAQGCRTDDSSRCTLLVIHEADGLWLFHALGAPGVKLFR